MKENHLFLNENKCLKLFILNGIHSFLKPILVLENEKILNFEISLDEKYALVVDSKNVLMLYSLENKRKLGCLPLLETVRTIYSDGNQIMIQFLNGVLARLLILNQENGNFHLLREE